VNGGFVEAEIQGVAAGDEAVAAARARRGLSLSLAVIVLFWLGSTARQIWWTPRPGTVQELMLGVCVRAAVACALIWALLRAGGETLGALGLRREGFGRILAYGSLAAAAMFLVVNVGLNSLLAALMGRGTGAGLQALFRDPREAPYWVVAAIVGGGFAEELTRAFVLTRFERALGRGGLVLALIVGSVVFGVGHLYQGPTSAVSAGFSGLICAGIFLRRRRVVDAMVVHAVFDLLGIAAAYALYGQRG
jgi:membrane protease YdiL (CAAX protease family)